MLTFYSGSGSPFTWRVHLALEHKAIPCELKLLSFSAGDTRKPEFLALNPRHKVPVIVDEGFVLSESAAILEYLDERYANSGAPLFPGSPQNRALIRRLVCEADQYFASAMQKVVREIFFKPPAEWSDATLREERAACVEELGLFAGSMRGEYLAGILSAADFVLYPMVALLLRSEIKKPDLGIRAALDPALSSWMQRIEALPYFDKTYPPHWKSI
jgi:glutathione S-transferase